MKTKTISDHPGLIGQILRRHEERELRRFKRRNETDWRAFWITLAAVLLLTAIAATLAALL